MNKIAFITGVTGQDGSYLSELLLQKGYTVHGLIRPSSTPNTANLEHLLAEDSAYSNHFFLHSGDVTDSSVLNRIIKKIMPDEVYHLAAQSHVHTSFNVPIHTADTNALGTLRILEALRNCGLIKKTRFYQASTSELFGLAQETPQKESTPFHPRSPYAVAKLYAYWMTVNYRESYGLFGCNGILFNHESPRRGEHFVTRKITLAAARIAQGSQSCLYLGNLDARRDWGHARDYVEGMWRILNHSEPDDYILATGEQHTVREFAQRAFSEVGLTLHWDGNGVEETGYVSGPGKNAERPVIKINPTFFRPAEVENLCGDFSKAQTILGWTPQTKFEDLVREMVHADVNSITQSQPF